MGYYTRASAERFRKDLATGHHAKCGTELRFAGTGRSIWFDGFVGGGGEVRNVAEIYCPTCDETPTPPSYGAPIYESDIVEL